MMQVFPTIFRIFLAIISLATVFTAPSVSWAACDLKITSVVPCDADGNTHNPNIGDTYFIRVNWNVTGQPNSKYDVKIAIANQVEVAKGMGASGGSYWLYWGWNLALDGPISYSVTLDPSNVTGDTNRSNNSKSGTFTPTPPATSISYYGTTQRTGSQSMSATFGPNGGHLTSADIWLGVPTSDSFQNVVSNTAIAGSQTINTHPDGVPIHQWSLGATNLNAGNSTLTGQQSFVLEQSNVKVSPALLRNVTWAQLAQPMPANVACWLNPNSRIQSTDPRITAFVTKSLPKNFRSTMSPYDAARALHMAVASAIVYEEPPMTDGTAVGTLVAGHGDCGGFSALLVACLRNIGIPAKSLCGWWVGTDQTHCVLDLYLPGAGWIPADPTQCNGADNTGTYAYFFGSIPNMNEFCFVSVGEDFEASGISAGGLQIGGYWYWFNGSIHVTSSVTWKCNLQ